MNSKVKKALVLSLAFAVVFTSLFTAGLGKKSDWRTYAADANNAQYSLAGAEYWVYTDSACTTRAKTSSGSKNAVLTTGADGTTSEIELEAGTYYVKEVKASKGYGLDKTVYTAVVESGETSWVNASGGNQVKEVPQSAPLSIQKVDWDTGAAVKMAGIRFEVKYTDGGSITRTWTIKTDANGLASLDESHLVDGDTFYKNSQNQVVVPLGTVTVKEVSSPLGYARSDEVYTINIGWDGANASSETTTNISGSGSKSGTMDTNPIKVKFRDKKQSAPITIQKIDKETGKATPMGGAKFAGATFELTCTSGADNGKKWIMKADESGKASLEKVESESSAVYTNSAGKAALLIGKYTLKETSAPEGYILNNGTYTITVAADESGSETTSAVTGTDSSSGAKVVSTNPLEITYPNQVMRGDIHWNKIKERTNQPINVPFTIKSATTGEIHVAYAGENGEFWSTSNYNPHSTKTNANDAILNSDGTPKVDDKGWVDLSLLDSTAGIWFSKDKNGNVATEVNDNLGALPYDKYIINELRCEYNEGFDLLKNREFDTSRNAWDKDIGTVTNPLEEPKYDMYKVRNEDAETNGAGKFGFQYGDFVTYDVHITNEMSTGVWTVDVSDEFTEGAEYFTKPVVVGVKNATQKKLSDDKNVVTIAIEPRATAVVTYGALVKVSAKEYLAPAAKDSDSKKGEADCNMADRDNEPDEADGYKNVAYTTNTKFKPNDKSQPEVGGPDKDDDAQTPVKEPKIGTTLTDDANRKIISGTKATLVDTVEYEGLTPGNTYVIEGTLMVKDTKDPLVENGEKVTARSDEFVPTEANGKVTVTFTVDVENVMGKELVAFETAYKVKDKDGNKPKDENGKEVDEVEVAKHEDINDPSQTVEVPGYTIHKERIEEATAKGKKYGFAPGEKVTYDVTYTNTSKTALVKIKASDSFTEGAEYFTEPVVIKVEGAKESTVSEDKKTAEIKIKAGKSAVVTFETTVKAGAKEYLAAAAKDSDSLDKDGKPTNYKNQVNKTDDKDGYKNVAKAEDPTPEDPDDPNPDKPYDPLPPGDDPSQTPVKEPEIGTFLSDNAQKKKVVPGVATVLVDKVSYEGLTPGQKYAVVGEMIMKDTIDPLVENGVPVKAVGVFTPDKPNGETEVKFTVDTTTAAGKEIVAFETAYNITGIDLPESPTPEDVEKNGTPVAEHKDPKDPSQTIKILKPEIGTYLADDANRKTIGESEKTVLIDTVAYKNLMKGKKYAVVGELIVKESGDPLVENGKKVKAVGVFTPSETSGSTEVEFVVNTKGMAGKHLVAFETAYSLTGTDLEKAEDPSPDEVEQAGIKIAEHKNLKDKDQTVLIKEKPGKPVPRKTPDTGDHTAPYVLYGFAGLLLAALAAMIVMIRRRKATEK